MSLRKGKHLEAKQKMHLYISFPSFEISLYLYKAWFSLKNNQPIGCTCHATQLLMHASPTAGCSLLCATKEHICFVAAEHSLLFHYTQASNQKYPRFE